MSNRKTYEARYLQSYRREHPEKQEQWRINSEIRHLESCGYTVIQQRKQPEDMTVEELESYISEQQQKAREYQRNWKARNKEHIRQYNRRYRSEHPEKFKSASEKQKQCQKRWKDKHREQLRAYRRKYYALHKEEFKQYQAKWKAKNPDYGKLRWQRYKDALEKARKEQQARIRRDIQAQKRKGVNSND